MVNYIIRRLLIGALTFLVITFLVYALIRNIPGTAVTQQAGEMSTDHPMREEDRLLLMKQYDLDKPWPIGYVRYMYKVFVRGDLGYSTHKFQAVDSLLWYHLQNTLLLSIPSLLLSYLLAIPLGLYATARSGTIDERIVSTTLYMLYSVPAFVAALLLLIVFFVYLEGTIFELPLGMASDNYDELSFFGKVGDFFWHLILPVFCLTYGGLAYYSRFIKANMEEVIRQDYIRTARAKGVPPLRILVNHAFRNTMIQFVTILGLNLPAVVSGAIILERVFSWPGMGTLFIEAILARDYATIMAETLLFSALTLLGQLLADLLYAAVDPRIVYS